MNAVMREIDLETRLKKANVKLIRHPETCLYGGVILMGETSIVDDPAKCPTAYTDGLNKRYGRDFLSKLSDEEITGLVLHETLHVMLKHIPRHRDLMKENARLANIAMDYVVNDIIVSIKDAKLCKLPRGGFHDPMFRDWSVRRVYEYLKQEMDDGRGGDRPQESMDEHSDSLMEGMEPEQLEIFGQKVDEAIHQGGTLAGRFGAKIPRVIQDLMRPDIDWREVLQDFWTAHVRGADEYTWQRFNKRRVADDIYLPSAVTETIGEVILAIDTSGSIDNKDIAKVASRIQELCDTLPPERIRVLWWDTEVHGEQVFDGNYSEIVRMLKPMGGGGTRAGCVSDYITKNSLNADCMIVFTDGYVENPVTWSATIPAIWVIKEGGNETFVPPSGGKRVVMRA